MSNKWTRKSLYNMSRVSLIIVVKGQEKKHWTWEQNNIIIRTTLPRSKLPVVSIFDHDAVGRRKRELSFKKQLKASLDCNLQYKLSRGCYRITSKLISYDASIARKVSHQVSNLCVRAIQQTNLSAAHFCHTEDSSFNLNPFYSIPFFFLSSEEKDCEKDGNTCPKSKITTKM